MPDIVNLPLRKQVERAHAEAIKQLVKNAIDSTYYVALGEVMKRQLADQFNLTEAEAGYALSLACGKVVDHIKQFGAKS